MSKERIAFQIVCRCWVIVLGIGAGVGIISFAVLGSGPREAEDFWVSGMIFGLACVFLYILGGNALEAWGKSIYGEEFRIDG